MQEVGAWSLTGHRWGWGRLNHHGLQVQSPRVPHPQEAPSSCQA